jgi:peptidoglycan-N-acetylglucosamine deacetylase
MLILAVGGALVAFALFLFWLEPLALLPVFERLDRNTVYRVRTDLPLVALSFDDGPDPAFTPQVLDILERHGAKATFFLIGERALCHPELVTRMKDSGHEVANHYFTNGSAFYHSDRDFLDNLEKTERAIGPVNTPPLFRPPGGIARPRQLRLAQERGYTCVLGSAYPHDPLHPPIGYITWLIKKNLVPGTIVILHDGISDSSACIRTLPHILVEGRERGLRFVSIGELRKNSRNIGSR